MLPTISRDRLLAPGGGDEVLAVHLDLSSLYPVRECPQTLLCTEKHTHILINNAGKSRDGSDSIPDKTLKTSVPTIIPRKSMLP